MGEKKTAAALGLFDGVHTGHRAVLAAAAAQAENGLVPAAFTFEPESALYKTGGAVKYIYGRKLKVKLLRSCGIKTLLIARFDDVRDMSGEEFVQEILVNELNAAYVCCGRDFRFGKNASCTADDLRRFGEMYGFSVNIAEDVVADEETVSSSRIRTLLHNGNVAGANALLGEPYMISGKVIHGLELGRTIDVPTANQLFFPDQLLPRFGAYASRTETGGRIYRSVTDIGLKPTVKYAGLPLAETHIIGFSGDIYGQDITVRLDRFLRPEQAFESIDVLKAQIKADIAAAVRDV